MNEVLQTASTLGFTLPSPAYLFGALMFGLVGLAAWRIGRRREQPRAVWIGLTLMLYPYLIGSTWLLYSVGFALCALLWFSRA